MTILFSNNSATTVSGSITPTSTTVNLAAGTGALFPSPTGGDYFVGTFYKNDTSGLNEIVHCTQRVGDTLTIIRAQEETAAEQWNPGDQFASLITAGCLNQMAQKAPPVWPPPGFSPSCFVYTGRDQGTANAINIPLVTPDLLSLVEGMVFTFKILNTNTGPTTVTVKGSSHPAVRLDGTPLGAGNVHAGMMMQMWYDGAQFVLPVVPTAQQGVGEAPIDGKKYGRKDGNWSEITEGGLGNVTPPIITTPLPCLFYVNSATGIDDINVHDGLSAAKAWKTGQGAIDNIETYYAPRAHVTVQFAQGTYGPITITGSHIAEWSLYGNTAAPNLVMITAHGTLNPTGLSADDPPEAELRDYDIRNYEIGIRVVDALVTVEGFAFQSYQSNVYVGAGAVVTLCHCHTHRPPIRGDGKRYATVYVGRNGTLFYCGDHHHFCGDTQHHDCHTEVENGLCHFGREDHNERCHFYFESPECHFDKGTVWCHSGSHCNVWHDGCSFTQIAAVRGPKHRCEGGSGFDGCNGNINFFPGDVAGHTDTATYSYFR